MAAPVMPEVAKEDSKEGAVAFVKYYVQLLNAASSSGNTQSLRALHLRSCGACDSVADLIDRTYDLGGRIEGDGWTIRSVRFFRDPSHVDEALINTVVSVGAQRVYQSSSPEPKVFEGNPRREVLWGLRHKSGHWRIISLQVLPT